MDGELRAMAAARYRCLPGMSVRGQRVVDRLEVTRRWPGATADALRLYRRALTDPAHRLWDDRYGCGIEACCPQPDELRSWLEIVACNLPRQDRSRLRVILDQIDAHW